ncbi:MAG: ATP-binding cassette domain-containing protein [Legionella sp.]|nr:ATP-binding cassette domain-containing protein [Legionella sp.]
MTESIIEVSGLKNYLGGQWVHKDINFKINPGEIVAIIGGSGTGKTTILRSLLMLLKPTEGQIKIFGQDIATITHRNADALRRRWGMLFQHSALFAVKNVLENIMFPMEEFTVLDPSLMEKLAMLKIALVGLPPEAANKFPSELSGGMQRRAAAARALAMDPELLFLDEPTTGLDPHSARLFDELVLFLRDALHLTIVMVTHDMESLKRVPDRILFIGEGKILGDGPLETLRKDSHPLIADYFRKENL